MVKKGDLIASVALIILSLIVLIWVIPQEVVVSPHDRFTGPATFPKGITLLILGLSVVYLIGALREYLSLPKGDQAESQSEDKPQYSRLFIFLFILILYVTGMERIGFYVSTALFLAVLMVWFDRKNFIGIVLMATAIPLFIYLVFEVGLRVMMPRGLLF